MLYLLFALLLAAVVLLAFIAYGVISIHILSIEILCVLTEQGRWMSSHELRNEIGTNRSTPSYGALYATLEVLESQRRVESRKRQLTDEEYEARGRKGALEWRITPSGRTRRREDLQRTKGWWNDLIPEPA